MDEVLTAHVPTTGKSVECPNNSWTIERPSIDQCTRSGLHPSSLSSAVVLFEVGNSLTQTFTSRNRVRCLVRTLASRGVRRSPGVLVRVPSKGWFSHLRPCILRVYHPRLSYLPACPAACCRSFVRWFLLRPVPSPASRLRPRKVSSGPRSPAHP